MSIPIAIGASCRVRKTVSESDVYLFAGITGDFSPNHVDEDAMRQTAFGRRIAHGALIIGYMSAASTRILEGKEADRSTWTPVSAGYDRVRFLKPVFIGDTLEVFYTVTELETDRHRSRASIEVRNKSGALVAIATHILAFVSAEA